MKRSDTLHLVYLIHFDRPFGHARHYLGSTRDLDQRIEQHASGRGARLLDHVQQAGIGWTVVRCWVGGRAEERRLKAHGHGPRHCPICNPKRRYCPLCGRYLLAPTSAGGNWRLCCCAPVLL